ncbi:pre-mRNA-splicing factor ISY1 homolog [Oppia nitens]|uniref:pre-mRNA-splicing factor ISY1 homolog n=1 Tax=Oppia nitens TaxID=1686743 RepID=UPI0023DBEA13|nr:pre-mRNA-splicing factor ISY1 homolog [Oppia nitens]
MARNAEKAMTTLARWRQSQLDDTGTGDKQRRPYLASECHDLKEAQKWRLDIIREVSKKVTQIQNAGLGEFRIRDLNDQINKLLREKRHWEYRIHQLGGFTHKTGPRFENTGREVVGNRGYKYFGAAKDLPGVRELFSHEPPLIPRKTRAELMRDIDADYYGFRDEDDGVIVAEEQKLEKQLLAEVMASNGIEEFQELNDKSVDNDLDDDLDSSGPKRFISYVPYIPTQEEVQQELLRRKKQELLEKYTSGDN